MNLDEEICREFLEGMEKLLVVQSYTLSLERCGWWGIAIGILLLDALLNRYIYPTKSFIGDFWMDGGARQGVPHRRVFLISRKTYTNLAFLKSLRYLHSRAKTCGCTI